MIKNLFTVNENNLDNARSGFLHGLFNMFANILLPFISRTIVIKILGTEFLGLGGLFSSILNVLNLSELGIGAAISFMLYKPIAQGDVEHVNALLSFYKKCYRIIGCVVLIMGIGCIPILPQLIKGAYPENVNLYAIYLIYLSQSVLSYFLFAYKTVLLTANQRYDIFVFVQTFTKILITFFQIILLLSFRTYYAYIILLPVSSLLQNIFDNYFIVKLFPQYSAKGIIQKDEKKDFLKRVIGAFSTKIGEIIYLSADQIIISAILGLKVLGIYTNYYYIITSLIAIFAIFHNTVRPILGRHVAIKPVEENFDEFRTINYGYGLFSIWCSCCLLVLYQPFMKVWVGEEAMFENNMIILFSIYFFTGRLSSVLGIYRDSCGIWWEGKFVSLIGGFGNLLINLILVHFIGLLGILISSIIMSLFITLPGYFKILFKNYFCNAMYKKIFLLDIIWLITCYVLVSVVTFLLMNLMKDGGILLFIVKAICCGILCLLVIIVVNLWNINLKKLIKIGKNIVKK